MIIGVTNGTIVNITLPTFVSTKLAVSYHGNNYTNGDVFTVFPCLLQTLLFLLWLLLELLCCYVLHFPH
jgi:hypothetical protein